MADYTFDGYEGGDSAPTRSASVASLANWAGAAVSLALVIGISVWGYRVVMRDVSGVPVVRAMEGPMRITPEDPGGELTDNQGLAVNEVAGSGEAAGPVDRLVLAPRPAGLGADDVPQGALPDVTEEERRARIGGTGSGQPVAQDSDDPIQALAERLAAGARPLSDVDETPSDEASPLRTADLPEPLESAPVPGARQPEPAGTAPSVSSRGEVAEAAPQEQPSAVAEGPGLAVSLRPKLRPSGIRTASLGTPPAEAAAAVAASNSKVEEIDPEMLASGTRLVQIGAFDSPETARSEWDRLTGRFGDYLVDKARVIERASSGGRVFYRLRAHGFDDLADARRFCAAFVAGNVDCIPVVTR